MEELKEKKVVELKILAKKASIKGYSKMTKDMLIKAILGEKLKESLPATKKPKLTRRKRITPVKSSHIEIFKSSDLNITKEPEIQKIDIEPEDRVDRKFDMGRSIEKAKRDEDTTIPESYGIDRLILLPRDANYLFCYWELSEKTLKRASKDLNNPQPVLRINIFSEKEYTKEYTKDVDLRWKKYYINVEEKGIPYYAELGLKTKDGKFHVILKSNIVFSSTDSVSSDTREIFMNVPFEISLKAYAKDEKRFYISPTGKLLSEKEYKEMFYKGFAAGSSYWQK